MKKILVLIFIINCVSELQSQQFITPINFIETEANKEAVIKYIEKNVKEHFFLISLYCTGMGGVNNEIGAENNMENRRSAEIQELNAFKELTKAKNLTLLKNVIQELQSIEENKTLSYLMILNTYNNPQEMQHLQW